jgi:sigma-B regulation protein RsbU (phosphoserine phosphatase)
MSSDSYPRFLAQLDTNAGASTKGVEYLEVRPKEGGEVLRFSLTKRRVSIGRSPDADLTLQGGTVSRYHAELQCESHGIWWVHDLNSTNGTFVNGRAVTNQLLNYGDAIGVGDYLVILRMDGGYLHSTHHTIPPSAPPPSPLKSRPGEVVLEQAMATNTFVANLQHVSQADRRRQMLCEYASSRSFAANFSWVVNVSEDNQVTLVAGRYPDRLVPLTDTAAGNLDNQPEALATLEWCKVNAVKLKEAQQAVLVQSPSDPTDRVIACPLLRGPGQIELFCVRLEPKLKADEWIQLVTFLADGAARSDELWRLREDFQRTAKIQYELSLAQQIQQSLVPGTTFFQGLEVSFSFEPSRSVGGDYVDFATLDDGRILLAIADVCGKGLQAALISISLHTLLHVLANVSPDLPSLVRSINKHLTRYVPDHSFVTGIFLAVDPKTATVECINAGHPPPLLLNKDGTLRELQSNTNVPLGIIEIDPISATFTMERDEVLFMYTDGLTEAQSATGSLLGVDGLKALCARVLRSAPDSELDVLKSRFEANVAAYQGNAVTADDRAFLLARLTDDSRRDPREMATLRPPAEPSRT